MIEFIQLSSDTVMIGIEFVYHYFDNQINSRWGGGVGGRSKIFCPKSQLFGIGINECYILYLRA
jgi:hypothetical protein